MGTPLKLLTVSEPLLPLYDVVFPAKSKTSDICPAQETLEKCLNLCPSANILSTKQDNAHAIPAKRIFIERHSSRKLCREIVLRMSWHSPNAAPPGVSEEARICRQKPSIHRKQTITRETLLKQGPLFSLIPRITPSSSSERQRIRHC